MVDRAGCAHVIEVGVRVKQEHGCRARALEHGEDFLRLVPRVDDNGLACSIVHENRAVARQRTDRKSLHGDQRTTGTTVSTSWSSLRPAFAQTFSAEPRLIWIDH